MLSLSLFWHSLWFLRVALHVGLLLLIVQRRLYREFPLFAVYIAWTACLSAGLLGMNYAPFVTGYQYVAAYRFGAAITAILSFAVAYEIFRLVLQGYPTLKKRGVALLRGTTVILLVIVLGLAWFAPARGTDHVMSVFFVLQRTVNMVLAGLLFCVLSFAGLCGLSWSSRVSGIALGLGILATMNLASSAIRAQVAPIARNQVTDIMELVAQGTYLCAIVVWMAYFCIAEVRSPETVRTVPQHDLETWNHELERLLHS